MKSKISSFYTLTGVRNYSCLVTAFIFGMGAACSQAANFTWTGGGANTNWSTTQNWASGSAPVTNDSTQDILFSSTASGTSVNIDAPYSIKSISFGAASGNAVTMAGSFTLGGSDLTLAGAIFNGGSKNQVINNNITFASTSSSGITVANAGGGRLTINGSVTMGAAFGNSNALSLSAFSGNPLVMNGAISGAGGITVAGNGAHQDCAVYLNGANTYTGTNNIIYKVTAYLGSDALNNSAGSLGNSGSNTLVGLGTGGGGDYTGVLTNGAYTVDKSFALRATSNNATTAYVLGGATAGVSNYTGFVQLTQAASGGAANPILLTAAAGGTVKFTGANQKYSNIFYRNATATGTADSLTKIGEGTVILQGQSNYQGATIINSGTLSVAMLANGGAAGSALGKATSDASNLRIQGSVLQYTGASTSTDRLFTIAPTGATIDASGVGALNFSNTGKIVTADAASRTAALTNGTNAVAFSSYTDIGDLKVGMAVSGNGIAANTTISSVTISPTSGLPSIRLSQAATVTGATTLTFGAVSSSQLTLTGTNTGDNTIAGSLGDSSGGSVLSVTKDGVGKWILSGTNTYTGATNVTAGELGISGSLASGSVNVSSGAILSGNGVISGVVTTSGTIAGGLTFGNNVTINNASTVTGGTFNANVINNGSITSALAIQGGKMLSGAGSVTGAVTVQGGTIYGNNMTVGDVTFNGNSTLSGTTSSSSITVSSGSTSATGVASTSGTVTVSMGASLANTGSISANSVDVTNGATLSNNGILTGAVKVSGLMNGTGTVDGALTLKNGGELAPGNSPGLTTVTGALVVENGAVVSMQIDGLAGAGVASGGYDQIIVEPTGSVTLGIGSILGLTFGTTLAVNDSLTLIDNQTAYAMNGTFSSVLLSGTTITLDSSNTFNYDGSTYMLSYTGISGTDGIGNDLTLTVVPEPSTWTMLIGGVGLLGFVQRLRRSRNAA